MIDMKKIKKFTKGMVDTSHKNITKRVAIASGKIYLSSKAFKALIDGRSPKGNVLEAAKIAGILAAKKTSEMIPFCHPLSLNKVHVTLEPDHKDHFLKINAEVCCLGQTGVEMEALCAVSTAALTVYDMMKWAGKDMTIEDIKLDFKSGGESGTYQRKK